jgi:hypothetical protein
VTTISGHPVDSIVYDGELFGWHVLVWALGQQDKIDIVTATWLQNVLLRGQFKESGCQRIILKWALGR